MWRKLLDKLAGKASSEFAHSAGTDEAEPVMHIFLGQGNPGPKYAGNRHNLGFQVLDQIADDHGFGPWRSKFQGLVCEGKLGGEKTLLLKPETFYNETGRAAQAALAFYKLGPGQLTVFHDEIDLAPGRLRVKFGGGHSGNNGLRSIIAHLGPDVRRIRMGVGHPGDKSRVMPYLLSDFAVADADWHTALIKAISRSVPLLITDSDERFQTEVMRLAPAPKQDPRKSASSD